jgi:ABC-type sugar transport system permease subunit
MGRATALAFILALFIMGVTYLAKRFSKEESLY